MTKEALFNGTLGPREPKENEPILPARRLERLFGKPHAEWKVDDLVDLVADNRIRLVSLMHIGGDGWLKTLDFVPRSINHLRDVIEGGERADGSSLFPGTGIRPGASDILLRPRVSSAFLNPFSTLPALTLLCSHSGRDGQPLPQSPDTILRAAAQRVHAELGVDLMALGEVEYFLGKRSEEEDIYGTDDRGYHASSPFVFGERLRRNALALLAEIGVPIKYGHSEVGYIPATEGDNTIWEQHEIELALAPLVEAADGVALTQWVLRNLAHAEGLRCSFDPIMRKGHAGSGLHFHVSPVKAGAHLPVFLSEGVLSDPARWLIAGLVQYGAGLMAFGNRTEGSFIRLNQAKEAPSAVAWGQFDRLALIRLPILAQTPDGRLVSPPTVEFRLPDGSAQPFLLLAGLAQAMVAGRSMPDIDGLLARTTAAKVRENRTSGSHLPRNSREVADTLEVIRPILEAGGVFPAGMLEAMLTGLRPD